MIFGKRCFFGFTVSPGGEVWWFANPPAAREPERAELAAMTSDLWKQRLCDLFAEDAVGRAVRDLILPLIFRLQARSAGPQSLAWLFNHEVDWNRPIAT